MDRITVEVTPSRVRLIRSPLYFLVAALSGAAPTFGLLYVHHLGQTGVQAWDWRVLLVAGAVWLVVVFYSWVAGPVVGAALRRKPQDAG